MWRAAGSAGEVVLRRAGSKSLKWSEPGQKLASVRAGGRSERKEGFTGATMGTDASGRFLARLSLSQTCCMCLTSCGTEGKKYDVAGRQNEVG